jgi:hypothetical protein
MRKLRMTGLSELLAAGVIFLPLLVVTISAVSASPRTVPIGTQLAELQASDTSRGQIFGSAVAISGTTAVVGADANARSVGRAYVFTKTAVGWRQVAELTGSDTIASDDFGGSVAISGTTAVVGADSHARRAGRAYVFTETAVGWKQVGELKGSDTVAGDGFGWSVAISGTTAVVGALGHADFAGRAYVFTETASSWRQVAELKGSDTVAGDGFGSSVAISGTTAVVGALPAGASIGGRAYVFTKTASGWEQVAELNASDTVGDEFSISVAISGVTLVVGVYANNAVGRAYVFTETASSWRQVAELKASDTVTGDFGGSVAISGTTTLVGADFAGSNIGGRAYLFTKMAAGWKQAAELKGSDTVGGDYFGVSVAISDDTALVGAVTAGSNIGGRAYVFKV